MHSAPSVSYPVGRSRYAQRLVLTIGLLGGSCAVAFTMQSDVFGWRHAVLALTMAVAGAVAWLGLRRATVAAELTFDGQHWSMAGGARLQAAQAGVLLDLQFLMLVRLAEPGRPVIWTWADRTTAPARWNALRRALYTRASPVEPAAKAPRQPPVDVHHLSS